MTFTVAKLTAVFRNDEPFILRDVKTVSGREFFKAHKGDAALCRLLTGKSWGKDRPMTRIGVFSQLQGHRNAVVDRILNPPPAEDIGVAVENRPSRKRSRIATIAGLPATIEVMVPGFDGIGDAAVHMLPGLGHDPVWIELTKEVIDYMARTVVVDLDRLHEHETPTKKSPDVGGATPGLSYDCNRHAFRARCKGVNKYFPEKCFDNAREEAKLWLESQQQETAT